MKRCASVLLSLSLILLMFPASALAENGTLAAAGVNLQTASTSATNTAAGDVKHVVTKTLGTKSRTVPAAKDFHEAFGVKYGYPAYNGTFNADVTSKGGDAEAQEAAIVEENKAILDYDAIDENGNLFKGGVKKTSTADGKTVTKLVRHTAGVSNFGQAIPDDTPSTTKQLSLRMVRWGNVVTTLYAPPGEVVKVTLNSTSSDKAPKDLGLKAQIGNFSGNNHYTTIENTERYNLTRMPITEKTLDLNKEVNYIGSPLGGAILIYSNGIGGTTVDMTIEGAIEMPTYFYGETSRSELAEQLEKPGPYFAFSTPRGVRAVGPSSIIRGKDPDKLIAVMEFWDKAMGVSLQFEAGSFDKNDPDTNLMVEMFDPHIPAGAAVNMGQYCICPVSWGNNFLDIDQYISGGGWGVIHELNHSFPWGGAIDSMTEISNNVINAMTYQLYTNIAANRTEPTNRNNPSSGGLDGWSWCADMYTTMERQRLNQTPDANGTYPFARWNLGVYVPLQHRFGSDRFIEAVHLYHKKGGLYNKKLSGNALYTNSNVWMRAASEACGMNLGYYMRDIQDFPELATGDASQTDYITTDVREDLVDTGPVYIPSGCLYASGFVDGDEVIEMGRPFRIPYGHTKILNLNSSANGGYVSVANGETVELISHTQPDHGTLAAEGHANVLTYTPDPNHLDATFNVTMRLTVTDENSPYKGATQEVTYKISLLQDTSQYGFKTTFYNWPKTLAAYDEEAKSGDPLVNAIEAGVLDQLPSSTQIKCLAGFEGGGKEPAGRFAVVEGALALPKTGDVELEARGAVYYSTCLAATRDALPSAANAQRAKSRGGYQRIHVYVVPTGEEAPADASPYAAIINEGDPLYVRAYVGMAYDCTCRYHLSYIDNGTAKDFDASAYADKAPAGVETPAISDYTVPEKTYSYPDPTYQETKFYDFQPENMHGTTVTAEERDGDGWKALTTWSNNPAANIVDGYPEVTPADRTFMRGDLATHFHGRVNVGQPYEARFTFQLPQTMTFDTIRYKGHATQEYRGKMKNYEVWVGTSAADARLVLEDQARHGYDYEEFNMIDLPEKVTASYLCIVAKDAYRSTTSGEYYYAFSDLSVGTLHSLTGPGEIFSDFTSTTGTWNEDTEALVNTRSPIKATITGGSPPATASGTGTFEFKGTGIVIYSIKGPGYGTMRVTVDGDTANATDVDLSSDSTLGQQAVFWKSFGNTAAEHTVKVAPKNPGTDRINVEYFEAKGTEDSVAAINARSEDTGFFIKMDTTSVLYTGKEIKPTLTPYYKGEDVTDICRVNYYNNIDVGTATVVVTLSDESVREQAYAVFSIEKAPYGNRKAVKASFTGKKTSYAYGQKTLPKPAVTKNLPAGASTTFYYAASKTAKGKAWKKMTTSTLVPGTYYLWAVVSSKNYDDIITPRVKFTVKTGRISPAVAVKKVKAGTNFLQFPKQTATGIGKAKGITFDIYVKQVKKGAKWTKKVKGLTLAKLKKKTYKATKLKPQTKYQYQVRATKKVGKKTVATSTWTSKAIKTK